LLSKDTFKLLNEKEPTYLLQKLNRIILPPATMIKDNQLTLLSYQISPESGLDDGIIDNILNETNPSKALKIL
jgi:hypothetical protein